MVCCALCNHDESDGKSYRACQGSISVRQFNSVPTHSCNTHHACDSDATGCHVLHVATCVGIQCFRLHNFEKDISPFVPASIQGIVHVQDDASQQQLLLRVMTEEEQLECFLRERSRSLDVKVQQAVLWLPTTTQTDHHSIQHDQHDQQPQAMDTRTDTHSKNQAAGYVTVSGIDLPCRTADVSSLAATSPAQRLVHTSAMVDNIKAAALALCQNRPLLLEGPPGLSRLLF